MLYGHEKGRYSGEETFMGIRDRGFGVFLCGLSVRHGTRNAE